MIELSRTNDIFSVPKMCCRGKTTITDKGNTVLSIMHDFISIHPCFKGVILRGQMYLNPIYVYCISDDGVECLMFVGTSSISKKVERVIIPFW